MIEEKIIRKIITSRRIAATSKALLMSAVLRFEKGERELGRTDLNDEIGVSDATCKKHMRILTSIGALKVTRPANHSHPHSYKIGDLEEVL